MAQFIPPKPRLAFLVPKEWSNTQRGAFFEECAAQILTKQRYKVVQRVHVTGMEIDILAKHKDTGEVVYVECKFYNEPLSANVIDLILGKALRRSASKALLFSTAQPGKQAAGAIEELRTSPPPGPKFGFVGPDALLETFQDVYSANEPIVFDDLPEDSASITLVIPAGGTPFWALERRLGGVPHAVEIIDAKYSNTPVSLADAETLFRQHSMYLGLKVQPYHGTRRHRDRRSSSVSNAAVEETVTTVATADSLDDYRPCRPDDFVGRPELQKEILNFLESVRGSATTTRLMALVGASGFGKSSLIARLAHRLRNNKWKNRLYLYPVDVRSAQSPIYVARALQAGVMAAIANGFIDGDPRRIRLGGSGSLLGSEDMQQILRRLKSDDRVLVVFFDQFEELFSKDDLLPAFEAFRRLAFEVHAAQSNLVVGFSWRTGINLSDTNPAYHLWHSLADLRFEKEVGSFSRAEASQLIGQFETALDAKFVTPLRRRLEEQGAQQPWLLKKLCIHVYRELRRGETQSALVHRRLNVKTLFESDLAPLSDTQISCLRYIAKNSPADTLDILEMYDNKTLNELYDARLIVRAGQRYAVYWDTFRDYLNDGAVPAIRWMFVPHTTLNMVLAAFGLIQRRKGVTHEELAALLGYSDRTVYNIIVDLAHLLLCYRAADGGYYPHADVADADLRATATHLRKQFSEHALVQEIDASVAPGDAMTRTRLLEIVRQVFGAADVKSSTRDNYLSRLVPWLDFTGFININGELIARAEGQGKGFGNQTSTRIAGGGRRAVLFLGSTSPEQALQLLGLLEKQVAMSKKFVISKKLRNAASDLSGLGLAKWTNQKLSLTTSHLRGAALRDHFWEAVASSLAIVTYTRESERAPRASRQTVGARIARALGKTWSKSSAARYATGIRRYAVALQNARSQAVK